MRRGVTVGEITLTQALALGSIMNLLLLAKARTGGGNQGLTNSCHIGRLAGEGGHSLVER